MGKLALFVLTSIGIAVIGSVVAVVGLVVDSDPITRVGGWISFGASAPLAVLVVAGVPGVLLDAFSRARASFAQLCRRQR